MALSICMLSKGLSCVSKSHCKHKTTATRHCQIPTVAGGGAGSDYRVAMADQDVLPVFIVDAFTSTPFSGNPAAVCLITTNHVSSLSLHVHYPFNPLTVTIFTVVFGNGGG